MNAAFFSDALGQIGGKYLLEAQSYVSPKAVKKRGWVKGAALAACLCLVIGVTALCWPAADSPHTVLEDPTGANGCTGESVYPTEDGAPSLILNGTLYIVSPHQSFSMELSEGFVLAGEVEEGAFAGTAYYTNPAVPEWVYLYQPCSVWNHQVREEQMAYVRYVDARIRGDDYVCYNGTLYISLWSADAWGDRPDVSRESYDRAEALYGPRLEGEAPVGFVSLGKAEFSGYDSIPAGGLSCNTGTPEVFADPDDGGVLLVATQWFTAAEEGGSTLHTGYDVYIPYGQ